MTPPPIRVVVRYMPALFGHHFVEIEPGPAMAEIGISRSRCRHPNPWQGHEPSPAFRNLILDAAHRAIGKDGMIRWIIWPSGEVSTVKPSRHHGAEHVSTPA